MIVLGLDCSTSACSAALWEDGRVLARRFQAMTRGQSEALVPMVAEVMDEAGHSFAALDLIGVTVGPGAFTGLRIGLAAARGFALAAGLPLAGITTTLAVAHRVPPESRRERTVLAVVESKRDDVYLQAFTEDLSPLGPPVALPPSEAAGFCAGPLVVAGDAAPRVLEFLPGAVAVPEALYPDAAGVAELAACLWRQGDSLPPLPLYLRPADVTLPGARP